MSLDSDTWLANAFVTLCQEEDVISGEFLTLPRCYNHTNCVLVPTHVIFGMIAILVFDHVIKRHEGLWFWTTTALVGAL